MWICDRSAGEGNIIGIQTYTPPQKKNDIYSILVNYTLVVASEITRSEALCLVSTLQ